jgi:hypothetical protein
MTSDWLAAANFEQTHELVSAINTLSIHAKLALAGAAYTGDPAEVEQARSRLLAFLDRFGSLLEANESSPDGTIVGADPRLRDLAAQFLSAKRSLPQRSPLYALSLPALRRVIQSERPEDLRELVACLRDLRLLVEQQAYVDVIGILGDV